MGRTTFVTAVLGMLTALSWFWFAPTTFGGGVTYTVVSGSSMAPLIERGHLVLLRKADELHIGDVAGYQSSIGRTVLHRIVDVQDGRYVFQGDANYWQDTDRPQNSEILGRLWLTIPGWGARWTGSACPPGWRRSPACWPR